MENTHSKVQLIQVQNKQPYPHYNSSQALHFFKDDIPAYRDITDSDLAMLLYGKDFTGANGNEIGRAYVYNGSDERAYSVVQMKSAGLLSSYSGSYNARCVLIAHEFGHNFGATHNAAYSWGIYTLHQTIMTAVFNDQYPNYMDLQYSDLSRQGDSTHNNILLIANNKSTIEGFRTP